MALLAIATDGTPTFVDAAASPGDSYKNDGGPILLVVLTVARTLTVKSPHSGHGDYVKALAAGSHSIPRFDPIWWNTVVADTVEFEFDNPVGVSLAVIRSGVILDDPDAAPVRGMF